MNPDEWFGLGYIVAGILLIVWGIRRDLRRGGFGR